MPKENCQKKQSKKKIPKKLQGFLWSAPVKDLNLEEDKAYIINQILGYGGIEEWHWLFKNYSLAVIKRIFLHQPIKVYHPANFNFVKEILLELPKINLQKEKYVIGTPRIIG